MEKWSFNNLLLSKLSNVLDISASEIARRCGMRQQVFSRYTLNEIDISVQVLIKICNALRMPSHYFVSEDNNHILPNREEATIAANYWQPISWDRQAVEHTFGDGEGRIFWKDVAEAMGMSQQKPHNRFLLITRFPITDFLKTCSHLDISPFRFLIDNNRDCGKQKNKFHRQSGHIRNENIEDLRREIKTLTETAENLTKKYRVLLERHNRLERMVNDYIGDNIGLAAEPDPRSD